MKIRIKGNSVRIRLTRSEVERLGKEGYIEERTEFGNGIFTYALLSKEGIEGLSAGYEGNTMTMYVPAGVAQEWAVSETVGYSNTIDIGDDRQLALLLEKDFKCIDTSGNEDQSDNFEHPTQSCE